MKKNVVYTLRSHFLLCLEKGLAHEETCQSAPIVFSFRKEKGGPLMCVILKPRWLPQHSSRGLSGLSAALERTVRQMCPMTERTSA